jgi:predicted RNase H-like HicB family nuclease
VRYTAVLEQTRRNWSAYVPDLPGCVAAGKTREETEQLIREAILFHIEGLREDGEPIPRPGAWTATVDVPDELVEPAPLLSAGQPGDKAP